MHFPNGGFLNVFAAIDEYGSASDTDARGRIWEFTVDMDSSLIETAVAEWAVDNSYVIR